MSTVAVLMISVSCVVVVVAVVVGVYMASCDQVPWPQFILTLKRCNTTTPPPTITPAPAANLPKCAVGGLSFNGTNDVDVNGVVCQGCVAGSQMSSSACVQTQTQPLTQAQVNPFAGQTCQSVANQYGIVPNSTWGSANSNGTTFYAPGVRCGFVGVERD